MMLRPVVAMLAALVVVAACTASDSARGSGSIRSPATSPDDSREPGTSGGASLPASIVDPIVADAAARLGVDPSAVTIVSAQAQTFADASLGCPKPGEMYTQAIVEGYQVIVGVNGRQLDYRGSGPGRFRICENP